MIIEDFEQLSPEWFAARCGIPSASKFSDIVTSKGDPSKSAERYLYQLAGERITGAKVETYMNDAMKRGVELEGEARTLFEMIHGVEVRQVGLVYRDEQKQYSCSPDGIVGYDDGLEIKCPLIHTHVAYLLKGTLPVEYVQQVQGSMLITGFNVWWFMSYFPGLPPLILRIKRDEKFIAKLEAALDSFCTELAMVVGKLRGMAA
jgi:putative phage-type endonuclease